MSAKSKKSVVPKGAASKPVAGRRVYTSQFKREAEELVERERRDADVGGKGGARARSAEEEQDEESDGERAHGGEVLGGQEEAERCAGERAEQVRGRVGDPALLYSVRRASMGSTRVARRAGMSVATSSRRRNFFMGVVFGFKAAAPKRRRQPKRGFADSRETGQLQPAHAPQDELPHPAPSRHAHRRAPRAARAGSVPLCCPPPACRTAPPRRPRRGGAMSGAPLGRTSTACRQRRGMPTACSSSARS